MISPAMATMICVVTTDALLTPDAAESMLGRAVAGSFNRVTVDGEMSTNDCVFFFANGASGVELTDDDLELVATALDAVLLRLALMMVADGEGATKIVRAIVRGAGSDEDAALVCRAIADSPLVKTAMHGGDPNWGRVLSSAGAALPGRSFPRARLDLCGTKVVENATAVQISDADWAMLVDGDESTRDRDRPRSRTWATAEARSTSPIWATNTSPSTPNTIHRGGHARDLSKTGRDTTGIAPVHPDVQRERPWSSSTAARP